ncbi:MAG: DivIVA domain-containing protein [Clostridia bacterium]|nr:DivIVA domain-containing protein [Clostridia bacterium]
MNLPEEIRNKEFSISLRGYNITEVEDYIEMLLEKYDTLYNENAELADRLSQLSASHEANASAGRRAADIIEKAKKEAATIVANAKNATAAQGAGSFSDLLRLDTKINEKTREYNELCKKVDEFKNSVFALYSAHISSLSSLNAEPIATKDNIAEPKAPAESRPEPKLEARSVESDENNAEKTVVFNVPEQGVNTTRAERIKESRDDIKVYDPSEKTETEEFAFTTGLKITREPAGSASATKSFSAVKERLKNASGEETPATTKKQKKFF